MPVRRIAYKIVIALTGAAALSGSVACSTVVANVVPPPPSNLYALPEDAPARPFLGTYKFIGGSQEIDNVDKAINDSISSMIPLVRGIVRSRLVAANGIPKVLVFLADTRWFEVKVDGTRYVSHYDGTPYKVLTTTGDVMDLHYKFGDTIEQTFSDEAKERINTFELKDTRMLMHVRIHADVLPKDINYDLTFERADPPAPAAATAAASAGASSKAASALGGSSAGAPGPSKPTPQN